MKRATHVFGEVRKGGGGGTGEKSLGKKIKEKKRGD